MRKIIIAITLILTLTAVPYGNGTFGEAFGAVRYMPDVTPEMSQASYWSSRTYAPDAVLVTPEYIKEVNQQIYERSSQTRDLSKWSQETYNGIEQNELNESSLRADGYSYAMSDIGWWWDEENKKWSSKDAMGHIYEPIIANGIDPEATENMPVKYAICTTRTCMQGFPSDYPLWDDPTDPDFDYLYHTMIRVGEPLILKSRSADGKYYLALSTGISGWIPAKDVAICANREEWLDAWYTDDVLVVWDDKIYTEDSNFAPQTANRKLPMGTRLPLASEEDIQGRINNRTAHNNHVVWMPVRNDDGSFSKELALIGENRKVNEGYLPLTTANILKVAMCQLGDAYGWGGMMGTEDCSGFMRDVYACFGLDLPRNVSRNNGVCKGWSLEGMTDEDKAAFIRQLPPGTILTFSGHEMMYLGQEGDKLYVISSVSNVRMPGDNFNTRIRGGVINTLDIWRGTNTTWLHNLNMAQVPYCLMEAGPWLANPVKAAGKTVRVKAGKTNTIATKKSMKITGQVGTLTYAKVKVDKKKYAKKFTINKNTGKITVKKGVKKGTYKMTVRVNAAGNEIYQAGKAKAVVKIAVK